MELVPVVELELNLFLEMDEIPGISGFWLLYGGFAAVAAAAAAAAFFVAVWMAWASFFAHAIQLRLRLRQLPRLRPPGTLRVRRTPPLSPW